jgi:catechol 2,3-dioxygenase-like lactoylglutathione lyase family enzyme
VPVVGPPTTWQTLAMVTFGVIVLSVSDVSRAEQFWTEALGYQLRRDGLGGWATVLTSPEGSGAKLALQRSATRPDDHPRTHIDLHVADAAEQQAETERLVALGAQLVEWDSYSEDPDFVVLADPDGNRFCIVDLSHNDH